MRSLAKLDQTYIWHPFTQMRDWMRREPVVIVQGDGAVLRDVHGRKYLDGNSSIWTNLHGHNHPKINAALRRQVAKIAHCSALGLANEPASLLAEKLVQAANRPPLARMASPSKFPAPAVSKRRLAKVFYSDDGATAMEVALKLAAEFARRTGRARKPKFLSLGGAYHGDTLGAAALGHLDLFKGAWASMMFKTDRVMAPYCYRCPFNRAQPERADAREYRRCHWECLGKLEQKLATQRRRSEPYAAFVFEPLMQGAAGMIPQPPGWLSRAAELARAHGALLVADEVMTGFGRTGLTQAAEHLPRHFACQQENVVPDFLALAKGLTGGYLPMAATLTTQAVFDAFLGEYGEFKTFFHGHSYTANQLGAAAALASLELLESSRSQRARRSLELELRRQLKSLWRHPNVGDIRQVGLIVGVELVRDWRAREPFDLRLHAGIRVCEAMARRGVLTRPVGNVIVLMPPYCTTSAQARKMVGALSEAIEEVFEQRDA
jgi:adenosylmethionine-8-amino-7-oxononanoate aminotransferase